MRVENGAAEWRQHLAREEPQLKGQELLNEALIRRNEAPLLLHKVEGLGKRILEMTHDIGNDDSSTARLAHHAMDNDALVLHSDTFDNVESALKCHSDILVSQVVEWHVIQRELGARSIVRPFHCDVQNVRDTRSVQISPSARISRTAEEEEARYDFGESLGQALELTSRI